MSTLKLRQSFLIRWGPAIIMMIVIFAFSSLPSNEIPDLGHLNLSVKKGGHMVGYALLAQAFLWGMGKERPSAVLWAWLFAVLYAITDEIHQAFVPGRGAWVVDVGIDALGAFLGLLREILQRK